MDKISVAVIGHGYLGKWHCQKVQVLDEANLVAIVESDLSKHDELCKLYPQTRICSKVEDCLDLAKAFIVVSPTVHHFELCKKLLANQKHIFCEKPLTATCAQSKELLGMKRDQVFQVGHSERCHQIWENQNLLAPFLEDACVEITRVAAFKGRATDVDVVADLMIHDIDLLYYLFKEYPSKVISKGFKQRTNRWDYVCSTFFFESGVKATVQVGRNDTKEVRELVLRNSQGTLRVDLVNNEVSSAFGKEDNPQEYVQKSSYPKRDHLLLEQQKFYQSIIHGSQPFVSIEEGHRAMEIVDGVLKSLENQSQIVDL